MSSSRPSPTARRTCSTSTRSASRRTGTASRRRSPSAAWAPGSTTRSRTTSCPRSGSTRDLPATAEACAQVLSLPGAPGAEPGRPRAGRRSGQRRGEGGCVMADLRAGLIGLGMMGRHHARVLRSLPGVELVAVADPGGDAARRRRRLEVGQRRPAPHRRRHRLRVVAVPTAFHEQIALALAEAGVHALVEKPLAPTSTAADADGRGVRLARAWSGAIGHIERYNPRSSSLRARLEAGRAGRRLPGRHPPPGPVPGPDRRRRRRQGPRDPRHRPDRLGDPVAVRLGRRPDRVPVGPRARGPGRRRRQARGRHRRQPPRQLAVADEGAHHDRHRRDAGRSSPTPSPPT